MTKAVIAVADTVLGYGSSQVLLLTRSLAQALGGRHLIYQPFVPNRKYVDLSDDGYRVETVVSVEHPWSWIGRMQYLNRVARELNDSRPDVLILPNYNVLAIIDLLTYKPRTIIHLALEDMEQFGDSYWGKRIVSKIKRLVAKIDLWIFPERNRAIHDCGVLKIPYEKVCILYNVNLDSFDIWSATQRNGRLVYAGSVDFNRSVARYLSAPDVRRQAIDIFGGLYGNAEQIEDFRGALSAEGSRLRYFDEVPAEVLNERLSQYSYSLVYWFPANWALRNAAPNKFFQALAAGVPVLAAPHPQCVSLIGRYDCGIVLKDWEFTTFTSGLKAAANKLGSADYAAMVEGCREACKKELNWATQFEKVVKLLERNGHLYPQ